MTKSSETIAEAIKAVVDGLSRDDIVGPDTTITQIPEPDPTTDMVIAIVTLLQDVAAVNGFLGIARQVCVSTGTVRAVKRAIDVRLMELAEAEHGQTEPK